MITRPFREHHLLRLLQQYDQQTLPLDLFINHYFRDHTALGSKDRGEIADNAYGMIRWRGLIDYLCGADANWEKRLTCFRQLSPADYAQDASIPLHIRLSFPLSLFELICKSHGEEKAIELCRLSNEPAPTTIRVNTLKTTRDALLQRWQVQYAVAPSVHAPCGITFQKKIALFALPEFKEGLFEVQDEGSQLLSELIAARPGQQVLDYCAGSGGKSLAIAPHMQGKGQLFLHDVRSHVLIEARRRLRRAGIQNAQVIQPESTQLKKLKQQMDWVLVDAPCSGTGTMRRNPDMKWKFTPEMLQRLVGQQRLIFEKALSYVKAGGHIVYATCSLLQEENQEQIAHFLKTYPLEQVGSFFQTLPFRGGMDGFFGAVLRKLSHSPSSPSENKEQESLNIKIC